VGDCVLAVTHWRGKSKDSGLAMDQKIVDYTSSPTGRSCELRSATRTWTRPSKPWA
jgi:hypothetical protein